MCSFVNAVLLDCDTSSGLIQEDDLFKSEYFYLMALAEEEEVSARKKPDPGPQKLPLEKPKPIGGVSVCSVLLLCMPRAASCCLALWIWSASGRSTMQKKVCARPRPNLARCKSHMEELLYETKMHQ